jgi:hypothetical protein
LIKGSVDLFTLIKGRNVVGMVAPKKTVYID